MFSYFHECCELFFIQKMCRDQSENIDIHIESETEAVLCEL